MSPSDRKLWSREELLIAFNMYCRIPFGKLHSRNPDIIILAQMIGRTPGALAMKLVNFASLDPLHIARNVKGLKNTSKADKVIWHEFHADWENLLIESQNALTAYRGFEENEKDVPRFLLRPDQKTEKETTTRVRLVQHFFRESVLSSYDEKCAICRINRRELLIAGHIIPWSINIRRRADPSNGIAFCALHDRAFERGFFAISDSFKIILSPTSIQESPSQLYKTAILDIEGTDLNLPHRFQPDHEALKYHRDNIFKA